MKIVMKLLKQSWRVTMLTLAFAVILPMSVNAAATLQEKNTKITGTVYAKGEYENWDGVSNVSQFKLADGTYCFAYNGKNMITVVETKKNGSIKHTFKLKKEHSLFGAVTCDKNGFFYVVS